MKCIRLSCLLLILVLFCSMFSVYVDAAEDSVSDNSQKESATDIKNTVVTEALPQADSVRWYQFTLENTCDAVVRFTTDFQEEGYYWQITVYRADDTYIKGDGAGKGTYLENDILLASMEPGTYYVCVQSRTKGSPGAPEKFYSDEPYSIQVITEGYAYPTGETRRETVSEAGQIIAVIGGKVYIKRFDGEAYVGCYVTQGYDGTESGPILLSDNADAVEYYTPYVTDRMWKIETMEWEENTYYYCTMWDGFDGVAADPTLYQCCEGQSVLAETAANDLVKLHFGGSPLEEEQKVAEEKEEKGNFWAIVVIAVIVIAGIAELIAILVKAGRSGRRIYGDTDGYDRVPTKRDLKDLADKAIADQIARNSHIEGYEADGPATGPGPEDFPSSGDLW